VTPFVRSFRRKPGLPRRRPSWADQTTVEGGNSGHRQEGGLTRTAQTIDLAHAASTPWDAIVVGAGPAGALSACLLARAALNVLLVERKPFPRRKVCGGCLNAHALAALARAGLDDRVRALGAKPVRALRLHQRARVATIDLPPGLAVSRRALDAELVSAAIEAGSAFLPETAALLVSEGEVPWRAGWRRVALHHQREHGVFAAARAVLVADGLAHSSLRECASLHGRVSASARIGVGGETEPGTIETRPGSITMAVGRHGYVGVVEIEGGRVNVAAAVDPAFLRGHGTTSLAIGAILAEAGVAAGTGLGTIDWMGTIPLTRHLPHPAARGLFVLGDAAGYVEPFTGEGMAWAFAGAEAVVPLVKRAQASHDDGLEQDWTRAYARGIGREQRWCRVVARVLRMPAVVTPLVRILRHHPGLASPVLAHLAPRNASTHGRNA
jgi:flavin-dependent dehydrogenase